MKQSIKIIVCSLFFVTVVFAQLFNNTTDVLETADNGEINYSSQVVRASGIGAPPADAVNPAQARAMAERAAVTVARRNLLEVIKGVRISSETIVKDFITQSDIIKTTVDGVVQSSRIIEKKYLPDGAVEVVVEMPLLGQMTTTVITNVGTQYVTASPQDVTPVDKTEAFTGLIIIAQGLGVKPAMSPKVLDESGKEVYGSAYVNREFAISQGMIGYAKNIDDAKKNPRVSPEPLVIKAIRTSGNMSADLVISNQDAEKLRRLSKTLKLFSECRAMVIL